MMVSPWATGLTKVLGIFVEYPCLALRIYSCSSSMGVNISSPKKELQESIQALGMCLGCYP